MLNCNFSCIFYESVVYRLIGAHRCRLGSS
nr:MAG TPA: hypothetical protein [Caudoviricetes sp.]